MMLLCGRWSQLKLLLRCLLLLLLCCFEALGDRIKLLQGQIAWLGRSTSGSIEASIGQLAGAGGLLGAAIVVLGPVAVV